MPSEPRQRVVAVQLTRKTFDRTLVIEVEVALGASEAPPFHQAVIQSVRDGTSEVAAADAQRDDWKTEAIAEAIEIEHTARENGGLGPFSLECKRRGRFTSSPQPSLFGGARAAICSKCGEQSFVS